jgi:phosphatidylglycerophosphatase A
VQGGFGIMIDDVLAGIFAGGVLWLVVHWGWLV